MNESRYPPLWRVERLAAIAATTGGGTPNRKNSEFFEGHIPWLTGYDLPEDTVGLIEKGREFLTDEAIYESATTLVKPGTILLTTRVNVGKLAIAQAELCFSQDITGITLYDENVADPEFVGFWLFFNKSQLSQRNQGTTITGIVREDVKNITLPLPPLPEQRRIVAILRQADALRRLRRDAHRQAMALLPALFEEMFGNLEKNPKGWEVVNLEFASKRITDGTHQSPAFTTDGIPFLFVSNITNGHIDYHSEKYISQNVFESLMRRCPVEIGDILYSTVGTYGVAVSVDTRKPFAFQRHIAHLKPDPLKVNTIFLREMLNSAYVKSQANRYARGVAQKTINLSEIAKFKIILPPLEVQEVFSNIAMKVQTLSMTQGEALNRLNHLFDSLLSRAFSGELTAAWRARHQEELARAAAERDRSLAEQSVVPRTAISLSTQSVPVTSDLDPRFALLERLSPEQQHIWEVARQTEAYFNADTLSQDADMTLVRTRQTLELLASVGLLVSVSLWSSEIGEFVPAYRVLREATLELTSDESYADDLALLREDG